MAVRSWPLLDSTPVVDAGLFRVARDRSLSPRTGAEHDFLRIDIADFVLVVAVTRAQALVLVRQYRHGARAASLEIPGGLHDPGETPQQGAERELREETGYGGGVWSLLGELRPQPALLSNRAWIFFADGVEFLSAPEPDPGEDIEIELLPSTALAASLAAGQLDNALTIAALGLARFAGHLGR